MLFDFFLPVSLSIIVIIIAFEHLTSIFNDVLDKF